MFVCIWFEFHAALSCCRVLASIPSSLDRNSGQNFCKGETHSLSSSLQIKAKTAASLLPERESNLHPHIRSAVRWTLSILAKCVGAAAKSGFWINRLNYGWNRPFCKLVSFAMRGAHGGWHGLGWRGNDFLSAGFGPWSPNRAAPTQARGDANQVCAKIAPQLPGAVY